MEQEIRQPKIGDMVSVIGHDGLFEVVRVNTHVDTADLRPKGTELILTGVRLDALQFVPKNEEPRGR